MNEEDKEQIQKIVKEAIHSEVSKLLLPFATAIGDIKEKVTSLAESNPHHF